MRLWGARILSEWFDKEIKRRANVIGSLPNEPAIVRLAGALAIEQTEARYLKRCYTTQESRTSVPRRDGTNPLLNKRV